MNRWTVTLAILIVMVLVALGCSGGGTNPTAPGDLTNGQQVTSSGAQTHLWGYYDVYVDIPSQTATAVLNRNAMFAANVTQFLNGNPANLQFVINGTPLVGTGVDVDIDVKITHPFAGATMYNGYDVRGIFLGNGSKSLMYKSSLKYAAYGASDQVMYDYDQDLTPSDPHAGKVGNPDGYTRWWNPTEFTTPGLFGYFKGLFASPNYNPTATLNPYKYYADGLTAEPALFPFLKGTTAHGVFSAGTTNTRNYYLRFPMPTPGVSFAYAVVANWKGEAPADHPANAKEAVALSVKITPDIYFESGTSKGGSFKMDVDVFDWDSHPVSGVMSDYKLVLESNLLTATHPFNTAEMTPIGGGTNYSTYRIDVPANNIVSTGGNEFWIIAEDSLSTYANDFGAPNSTGTDKLAAFFRSDIFVANVPYNQAPVCNLVCLTPMPASGTGSKKVDFDASASTDPDGDTITYTWDFDGDNVYGEATDDAYTGTPDKPSHTYIASYTGNVNVKENDGHGHDSICTVQVNVTILQLWSEKFTTNPANWYYETYMWESCTSPGAPGYTTIGPNGPSGSGNVRLPQSGNNFIGGVLCTVVTPPFAVPSGSSEVNLRVYYTQGWGGSYVCFKNMNWKMVESNTPGLAPFISAWPASLPSGGAYLQNATTHGSTFGVYETNPCSCYGPMQGQVGWDETIGGGAFPGSLTGYFDLILPASFYGKTVKVAIQYQTDECYYAGANTGFALDDYEVKTY